MALYLGIDMGTSYFKAALFNEQGRLCGLGRQFLNKQVSGAVCELPVTTFWSTLASCIAEALQQAGAKSHDIRAMSYSSQANSFILLDKGNDPITALILWPDARAGAVHPALSEWAATTRWHERTGIGVELSPNSAINKLLWLQQQPLWEEVASVCTISDYLALTLTGRKVADGSTASLLGLLNVTACQWWEEALEVTQLSRELLPDVFRMGTAIGTLTRSGAALLGLEEQTHFSLGGLDHHMAAMGAGIYQSNNISESTGTVLAAVQSTEQYLPRPEVCVGPGLHEHHYFRITFNGNGGRALEAYQKNMAPEYSIEALLEMAAAEPLDTHGKQVRSILESTAYSLKELVQQLGGDGKIIATGGGARSALWVLIKAVILNRPFIVPACSEAACLGAAMMAAHGIGDLSVEDTNKIWVTKNEQTTTW